MEGDCTLFGKVVTMTFGATSDSRGSYNMLLQRAILI